MITLDKLKNTDNTGKRIKRVGRGPGSGMGKTSCRGHKGAGARSGYKRRYGTEGGQLPLYRKLPTRGFSRKRFEKRLDAVNLYQIEECFSDGDIVDIQTLCEHGFISGTTYGFKVLAQGELTKKVTIHATAMSAATQQKLEKAGITFTVQEK